MGYTWGNKILLKRVLLNVLPSKVFCLRAIKYLVNLVYFIFYVFETLKCDNDCTVNVNVCQMISKVMCVCVYVYACVCMHMCMFVCVCLHLFY